METITEDVKYYFGDFVRKGGGGTPQIHIPFLSKILSVKGSTPQVRNFFFYQNTGVFWAKKTPFSGIFEQKLSVYGGRVPPHVRNSFFAENFVHKGGGGAPPLRTRSAK